MKSNKLTGVLLAAGLCTLAGSTAFAQLGASRTIDGDVTTDWSGVNDQVVAQNDTGNGFGDTLSMDALFVTWDLNFLYIGIAGDQSNGNMVTVFVDGNEGAASNNGWKNTLGELTDTSEANRIDVKVSNMEILFPTGFAADLFAAGADNSFVSSGDDNVPDGFGNWDGALDERNGVRTWNNGNPNDIGYDCCSGNDGGGRPAFEQSRVVSTDSQFELKIRWDRVFNAQTDAGDYNFTTGALPASHEGRIGILALLSNDGDDPYLSNQFLPPVTKDGSPTADNVAQPASLSTITAPFALTGVTVIDIDLDNNGILDVVGSANEAGRVSLNSAAPAISANSASAFFSNNVIEVVFNQTPLVGAGSEAGSALNPANYTLTDGGTTILSVAMGTGSRASSAFLTLSADITAAATLDVANVTDASGTNTIPTANFAPDPLNILDVTIDASADGNTFLGNPQVRGSWNGFGTGWPAVDGVDAYPEVPGDQIVAGDTAGDDIHVGRVFTSAAGSGNKYTITSYYEFGSLVATGKTTNRGLGTGYWVRNFDTKKDDFSALNLTKPFVSRLLAAPVTVTFDVSVPISGASAEFTAADVPDNVDMYIQAGPCFGSEGAIPTDPNTVLTGETDINGGLLLTYVSEDADFAYFSGQATYPSGVPDVSEFRLGYVYDNGGGPTTFREENSSFPNSEAGNVGQVTGEVDSTTIHGHAARLASNDGSRALGRTISLTYAVTSLDVPAPPTDGLTAVQDWALY